ncbi:MAG TPA: AAA family ATPase [Micromonosporaceae bacterium]|nr:AAA family ATPase [Micromonosporaceae bacterium]
MRPLRLDIAGFTVFREETCIDFTDADFFALVGPTGSGKSSVLDAICFALYGTVPRWADRRGVANALAPSASEARVRLVFESAGSRYVATRVVRRDGKGNAKTAAAGLELLPAGFDPRKFDTGLGPEDLGEVLAGTPGEMEAAVLDAVGLPYEQFTSCVVLPQGAFAEFLHAKPATRQQILVNLLGLSVYERIREQAAARAAQADARLAATDQLLGGLPGVDDEALVAAADRVTAVRRFAVDVDAAVPRLADAQRRAAAAATALAALDAQIGQLASVRPPAEATTLAAAVAAARAAVNDAAAAVQVAEEREEKLRGELAGAGDGAGLSLLLRQHEERDKLVKQLSALAKGVAAAEAEHVAAAAALGTAEFEAAAASAALDDARRAFQEAQTTDRAAALRAHLAVGEECPVCTQAVHEVPPMPAGSAVAAAEAAGQAARAAANAAADVVVQRDRAVRDLDRTLVSARAQHAQLAERAAELGGVLVDSPGPAALRSELDALAALQAGLADAVEALRGSREAHRRAQSGLDATEHRLRAAWRTFDGTRDRLAALSPPPADREDLGAGWRGLAEWAAREVEVRRAGRTAAAGTVSTAEAAVAAEREELAALFADAGLEPPARPDEAAFPRAAAVAVERAEAERRRLEERRAQAEELLRQRAGHERDGRVARALAGHLRANNFERWLLEEALDLLVDGASRILRELSSGQYELVHGKGEFFVVDHHDAGLRRGVRTLSGGETFQASLSLALALSEQLAGMSTSAASLESIVLDEGFGTLDGTTLDTVAATLENLAARGDRMVGVVTHVGALAERVPVRFEVRKDARTARVERLDP